MIRLATNRYDYQRDISKGYLADFVLLPNILNQKFGSFGKTRYLCIIAC